MPPNLNLCFHGIGTPERELEPGEAAYWITPDSYLEILDVVADDPRVSLSFDDGNLSDVVHGLPALLERGLTATFFVLAGRLDQSGSLGRDDVRGLVEAGMTIGSHGMDHRPWRGMGEDSRHRELVEARDVLAAVSGAAVDEAALPLGRYDRTLLAELRRLGYRTVHTSDRRWGREEQWLQPRFSARAHDTAQSIRDEVLTPSPTVRRMERAAVCTLKRWR